MHRPTLATPVLFACAVLALAAARPAAAQEILLEKRTNGQDADLPPGPVLTVGDPVAWTYQVTNASGRDIVAIEVTDDQGVVVTCPGTTLAAGVSMTCTGNGTVQAGQYANVGSVTAELQDGTPVGDSDPSHYFGQAAPALTLEKATEGIDADAPPGPSLAAGDAVAWTYEVTNVGGETIGEIEVTDSEGETVTCPETELDSGESMTCTASGTVQPGQYSNIGSATGILPDESPVAASDPSHYFGQTLLVEKSTNGFDADVPPGPTIEAGETVTWTYEVTNPGPATVTGLAVVDDQGVTVSCPDTTLDAGETVVCTASDTATGGPYANLGTATADLPAPGGTVSGSDPSHYVGTLIRIEKSTNGEDADTPPGPVVEVGSAIAWTYEVTNFSGETVTDVTVTDDQGVTVTCPMDTLTDGASMVCTANGAAQAGQYANVGTVTATHSSGEIADSDPSHYLGQDQTLDFGDAPDPTFPTLLASNGARHLLGSGVYLGACVDAELDGQPSATATGDDDDAGTAVFGTCAVAGDDEDGVVFPGLLVAGQTADVEVTANEACTLSAWIDFTGDGDWNDPGETLFPGGQALAPGANPLAFPVPEGTADGPRAARFRCTTDGEVTPGGEAADGEVEDYVVAIGSPALAATKTVAVSDDADGDGGASPGDTLLYTIVVTNQGAATATGVVVADTPDPNTDLVVGSVTTDTGAVTTGNTAGDATVEVAVGSLAPGADASVTFEVVVDPALPSGVEEIVNQGQASADNADATATDDPSEPGPDDPTVIALGEPLAVTQIPTLSGWGAAFLALLLGGLAWRRLAGGAG